MAIVLKSDVLIDNPDAPYIIVYDEIENRSGSLFLWDAQKNSIASSSNGVELTNLLADYSSEANKFAIISSTNATAAYVKKELTGKGGIHLIASQNADQTSLSNDNYLGVEMLQDFATALNTLLSANKDVYVSYWVKVTRTASATKATYVYYHMTNPSNYYAYMQQSHSAVVGAKKSDVSGGVFSTSLGNKKVQMNLSGKTGSPSGALKPSITVGTRSPQTVAAGANGSPSFIIYRIYVEDLTESGRTYEQVKAIDDAEFAKAFAEGGRFYGDTWSNPATILP